MSPRIGVVVPIYKVEKYVAECIESILAQTYKDFRLILVNDGSPDDAGKICDEYAKSDSRITVIHQRNAGVTRARARGVEEALDCEYITFVDGDDTIITNALQLLVETMNNNHDIVICHFKGYNYPQSKSINIIQYRHYLISGTVISCGPTSKLYRRHLFNEETFNIPQDIIHGEDLLMNIRLSFNTNKEVAIQETDIYCYREHDNGCNHTFKRTPEYEILFFNYTLLSIPSKDVDIFYKDTIKRRILIFEKETLYKYFPEKEWFGSDFQKCLLKDINTYNFKYPQLKLLLLKYNNSLFRKILILILKINNIIKRIR